MPYRVPRLVTASLLILASTACTRAKTDVSAESPSAPSASSNEILIGEFGAFTGSEATFGLSTHKAVVMAVEEFNKAGGVKGKTIRDVYLDNQGKADEAVSSVTRLITQDHVLAVIGEAASGRTLAAAPIAQQNKIPLLTPSSTNPKITEIGDYVFRVCFTDPFQGSAMARFANENLKAKRVAILWDVKSDYGESLSNVFATKFKQLGGEIVGDKTYVTGDIDFKAQLIGIRSAKPDAIFVPGYYTDVGLIARQARQLGIKAPLLGGDGWDSSTLYDIGKDAINGSYFLTHYTTETTDPRVQDFIKRYKEKYNENPDGMAALGYDGARVLLLAMKNAAELTPKGIRDALAKIQDFAGVTGVISIDASRNARKAGVVVKVDGPINRFVRTIGPE